MTDSTPIKMQYIKKLDAELLDYKKLYPQYKKPFQLAQRLGALNFYRDSFTDKSIFCEVGRLADTKLYKDIGHVQSMNTGNWTPIANDCWLLGVFHSAKTIRLRTTNFNAIWDPSRPGTNRSEYAFPVTRREITGILEFGFVVDSKENDCITFKSTNPDAVANATLAKYAASTTLAKRNGSKVHDFIGEYMDKPPIDDDYWK